MNGNARNKNDFFNTKVNEDYPKLFLHRKKADLHLCQTSRTECFEKIVK